MKYIQVAFAIASIAFFISCNSNSKLTREEAEKIIRQAEHFPRPQAQDIAKEFYFKPWVLPHNANIRNTVDFLKELESKGIISIEEGTDEDMTGTNTKYTITFTDDGKKFLIGDGGNFYSIRVCDQDIKEVTGIVERDQGQKTASVDYTIVNSNPTPFAEHYNVNMNDIKTAQAQLIKYDDGWRMNK